MIFRPKREEVAGGWGRLHNEELHNLCVSPYITRVMTASRMRWAGHVAYMGQMRNAYVILIRDHSEDLRVDCKIILKC
jgi:hypothetical protein